MITNLIKLPETPNELSNDFSNISRHPMNNEREFRKALLEIRRMELNLFARVERGEITEQEANECFEIMKKDYMEQYR